VDSGGGGSWSIGDAFHDAGRVLTVMAGILLISAAVLVPIGLIGGLAWLTARAVIRKRREDALE
jgi:N-methylhydantoinase B/oxoprolinase/acetone carboxylase alpha subunit